MFAILEEEEDANFEAQEEGEESWQGTSRDYTYHEVSVISLSRHVLPRTNFYSHYIPPPKKLLSRVFRILRQNNPEMSGDRRRYVMIPPQVMREGNKKTVFANLNEMCKRFGEGLLTAVSKVMQIDPCSLECIVNPSMLFNTYLRNWVQLVQLTVPIG
jgi:hypothetical protein